MARSVHAGNANRRSNTGGTRAGEHLHQCLEAAALGADHILGRDTDRVKHDVGGVGSTDAHFILMLADRNTFPVPLNNKQGNAFIAPCRGP